MNRRVIAIFAESLGLIAGISGTTLFLWCAFVEYGIASKWPLAMIACYLVMSKEALCFSSKKLIEISQARP